MTTDRRGQVVVSGTGRPGDPFVFADADEAPVWSAAERAQRRQARRDLAHDEAIDRLTHHRKDEDR